MALPRFKFLGLVFKAPEGLASAFLCSLSFVGSHVNPHQLPPGAAVLQRHLGVLFHRVFAWSMGKTSVVDTGEVLDMNLLNEIKPYFPL